ncbi:PAS domain S-box-containing protein [Cohaesibacter sp. ES.047]|uniref:sensor histidine kinase n=1 Tax=Cohaesibacter sp. ES.047 TaxID=1798205 RepID=UPI000BBFC0FB|nr:PAS domain S-box protein [Cohaesibacter sp. ES.047]SNY93591.1 PAS domain S-box-containing protein [Cohaesibacter sp. ES.047]
MGIGLVCLVIGTIIIGIWSWQLEEVAQSFPIILAMQFNTALCLVLLGIAFMLAVKRVTLLVYAMTACVALISGLTLYQYPSGISLGIDTLFIEPFVTIGAIAPGRMAPNTAICFLLTAVGISIPRIQFANYSRLALGFCVLGIAIIALLGYVIRLDRAHDWVGPARMSPHTSIGFLVLGLGLVYLGTERGRGHFKLIASSVSVVAYLAVLIITYLEFSAEEARLNLRFTAGGGADVQQTLSSLVLISGILYLGLTGYAFWYSQRYGRSAESLAESEAQLAAIIDNAVDGIISIDTSGTILSANRACKDIFGFTRAEMIGQNIKMLMPKRYSDEHDSYLDNYHRTHEAKIIGIGRELEGLRKDGTEFPLELAVSRIDLPNRVIYTGIVRDITDRKRTMVELLEANAELEEFTYRTSHDLRSPIASSIGLVRIAKELLRDREYGELANTLVRLESNFRRMDMLIQNIIEVARTRLMVEGFEPISVRAVIDEALDDLSHMEGFSEMAIHVDIDPDLRIISKPIKLQMIVCNLLSNAIKYRDPQEPTSELNISVRNERGAVRIAFADNGLGIPPEARPNLFEMFKRFHPDKAFGSGLGLYIMKKSTESLGGTVTFEPQQKGCLFVVVLPKGDKHADADHPDR